LVLAKVFFSEPKTGNAEAGYLDVYEWLTRIYIYILFLVNELLTFKTIADQIMATIHPNLKP